MTLTPGNEYTYECGRHFIYEEKGEDPVGTEAVRAQVRLDRVQGNVAYVSIIDGSKWRSMGNEFMCLTHDLHAQH